MNTFHKGVPTGGYCYGYVPAPDSGYSDAGAVEAHLRKKYGESLSGAALMEHDRLLVVKHCKFWNPTEHGFVECTYLNQRALWITTTEAHIEKAISYFGTEEIMNENIIGYLLGDAIKACQLNRAGADFDID